MAPAAKAKAGGTAADPKGATAKAGAPNKEKGAHGTRVQIMLENKIVTPQPLVVGGENETRGGGKTLDEKLSMLGRGLDLQMPSTKIEGLTEQVGKDVDGKVNLEEIVTKNLTETETQMLFSVPSLCVALDDTELHSAISAKNKKYEELLASRRNAADQYKNQHQQTLNNPHKTKEVLAVPAHQDSRGVSVTEWDIHDTFVIPAIEIHEQIQQNLTGDAEVIVGQCLKKKGCLFNLSTDGGRGAVLAADAKAAEEETNLEWTLLEEINFESNFLDSVITMEKIVIQNVFHEQHMVYRNYPTLEELARNEEQWTRTADNTKDKQRNKEKGDGEGSDEEQSDEEVENEEPALTDLFSFDAQGLTKELPTTTAEWNCHQKDLLAVSYGDTGGTLESLKARSRRDGSKGLILFWSLKNPSYPERIIKTNSGVSALAFSQAHPSIIAAGMVDGNVAVWDSRKATSVPVLMSGSSVSTHNDRKHTDCVWEVKWVGGSTGGGSGGGGGGDLENLFSVAADGKIFQWGMRKGLEQKVLMNLKRVPNHHLGSNAFRPADQQQNYSGAFRKAAGMGIDILDSASYLVCTEDGLIHRCSTSHNEQYLDTFQGHSGTVYRTRCNPWYPNVFLTCSADWTMRLWSTKTALYYNATNSSVGGGAPPVGGAAAAPDASAQLGDGADAGGMAAGGPISSATGSGAMSSMTLDSPLIATFQSTDLVSGVGDVCWAPYNSTSFAACMEDGRVELWDLARRAHDPLIVHHPKDLKGTVFCRFASNSPVLVCGDQKGTVAVMRMYRTEVPYMSNQEQIDKLLNVIADSLSK